MDYQTAKDIRGRSLTSLITTKILSGSGVGSSIGRSISQKMKARATGIKEKFDPMNVARFVTGGSKLSAAIVGKLTGRSQRDIEYFAGPKKRKYTRITTSKPMDLNASSMDVLNQMFDFFKRIDERDSKRRETERAFLEEKQMEEERRHGEFVTILKSFLETSPQIVEKKEEEKKDGLLSSLGAVIGSVFGVFKTLLKSLAGLFKKILRPILNGLAVLIRTIFGGIKTLIGKLFTSILKSLSWLRLGLFPFMKNLLPLLARVTGVIGLPLLLIYGGAKALENLARNMKDFSQLSPQEARNILDSGDLRQIDNFPGGREALLEIARGSDLNPYVSTSGGPSTDELLQRMPEYAPTLSQSVREGSTGQQRKNQEERWFQRYGKYYDPETGLRKDLVDFVGPLKTDPKTGRLMSELSMSPDDRANISAATATPEETVTPYSVPQSSGDLLGENSAELERQRMLSRGYQMGSAPNARDIVNNQSSRVPLPEAPEPRAADVRNVQRIWRAVIEKNQAPLK